ncbi:hypothetical protein QN277_000721 [Acacia crassicarpa]|uniref:Uncharacterized protein n=1 Tax=Acacia crassicarpa TaxID=499986 RepID=A0AAE1N5Y5_9FABA|nr:hypothetical protein QN277_000721 [Acacia crassicarpa]
MASSTNQTKNIENVLYNALMRENWQEVVTLFKVHPEIHATKIAEMVPNKVMADADDDQYGSDTALHWAITHKADDLAVKELVFAIKKEHSSDGDMASEILKSKNKRGNTPLHCAATRGSDDICKAIVESDKSLVNEQNNDGETPLFLAALNNHPSVFFYLHSIHKDRNPTFPPSIWQKNNGDTILHCTIRRNYLGLSYEIIQRFKRESIGSYFNIDGKLPLDEIVSIPSAFKTGILMGG